MGLLFGVINSLWGGKKHVNAHLKIKKRPETELRRVSSEVDVSPILIMLFKIVDGLVKESQAIII